MAITILSRPHRISSSSNNNIWSVSSDIPTLVYLMVIVKESTTGDIVAQKKVYRKPNSHTIEFNLSDILINLGESNLYNNNSIISASSIPAYKIEIEEWFINIDILTTVPKYVDTEVHYFFEGNINDIDFLSYNSNQFNLNTTSKASFLTNTEAIKEVVHGQKEYLKIFNVDGITAKLKLSYYDTWGGILKTILMDLPNEKSVISLNVSPSIVLSHPEIIGTEEAELTGIYKITIVDNVGNEITESKVYKIVNQDCNIKPTHIIYKNPLGGFDSIKFLNRVESISVTKNTMNGFVGNNKFTEDGKYSNGKLHINTIILTTYTATSELMNDVQSKLMKELLYSDKVYVVHDQYLIEVSIDTNKYKVLQRNINGGKKSRLEISFTSPVSIEKLEGKTTANDINLSQNNTTVYLTIEGEYVVDNRGNYIILK